MDGGWVGEEPDPKEKERKGNTVKLRTLSIKRAHLNVAIQKLVIVTYFCCCCCCLNQMFHKQAVFGGN